jgi:hypothetical protein
MKNSRRHLNALAIGAALALGAAACSTDETVYEDDPIEESEAPDSTVAGGADDVTDLSENGPGATDDQDLDGDGVSGNIPEEAND